MCLYLSGVWCVSVGRKKCGLGGNAFDNDDWFSEDLYQSDSSQRRSLRSCLGGAHDEFVTQEIVLVQFLDSPFCVGNPYFVFQITIREPLGSVGYLATSQSC